MRIKGTLCKGTLCIAIILAFWCCVSALGSPVRAAELKFGGIVNVDLYGSRQKNTDSTSDLKLDLIQLSLNSKINEHVSADAVVKYEKGYEEDYIMSVDEAYLTLTGLTDLALSIKAGRLYPPFGVFANHLVYYPLTQDKYQINPLAVSFIYTPEEAEGLDLSATAYSNKDSLFTDPNSEDDLGNYILSASFAPMKPFKLDIYFDSEKGAGGSRDDTWGSSLSAAYQDLSFDAEYIGALHRDDEHSKESAYTISGAYKVKPDLELAGRFEGYNDGVPGNQKFNDPNTIKDHNDDWVGLEYRVSAGVNYELYEHTNLMAEFRVSKVEGPVEGADVSNVKDWTLRLSVEF